MAGSSSNGTVAPAAFPPPVDPTSEFIKREIDAEDDRIEVGVAIVGGGTAGLACANRLLALLAEDEELLESLGEVPVAVIEKAKTCGGHNLSGAVMRPRPLEQLFPDLSREDWRNEGFAFGAVAATRAVVDAGWYPYSTQIGQTGKTVSPKLYLAAGISGAIQHKVGFQSSENIIAINKDSNAPIFEYSDLGIVGDLNKILPKLTEAVKAKKG